MPNQTGSCYTCAKLSEQRLFPTTGGYSTNGVSKLTRMLLWTALDFIINTDSQRLATYMPKLYDLLSQNHTIYKKM